MAGYRYVPPPDFSAGVPNYGVMFKPQQLDVSPLTQFVEQQIAQEKEQFKRQQAEKEAAESARRFGMNYKLAENQDSRAAAAEGRNEKLFPGQLDAQRAEIAQRQAQTAAAYRNSPEGRQKMLDQLKREGVPLDSPEAKFRLEGGLPTPKNDLDAAKAGFLKRLMEDEGGTPQPGAGRPTLQPQSYDGGGSQPMSPMPAAAPGNMTPMSAGDPNLIRVQQPGQEPQQQQPQQDMIETPLGRMTPAQAKKRGMGMAIIGMGDAGKMLVEEANRGQLGKEAGNANDKRELDTTELHSRLNTIADTYKPEYLQAKTQLQQWGLWAKGKLGGKLTPEQEGVRQGFETFKSSTLDNLNRYIKEITGAAMTDSEAQRIIGTMPNINDDPAAFEAKLNASRTQAGLAVARYRYLRQEGFKGQPWDVGRASAQMSLQKMQQTIRERAQQHYREIKQAAPQARDDEVYGAVKRKIASEFGIDA